MSINIDLYRRRVCDQRCSIGSVRKQRRHSIEQALSVWLSKSLNQEAIERITKSSLKGDSSKLNRRATRNDPCAHVMALSAGPVAARGVRRISLRMAKVIHHRGEKLKVGSVRLGAFARSATSARKGDGRAAHQRIDAVPRRSWIVPARTLLSVSDGLSNSQFL